MKEVDEDCQRFTAYYRDLGFFQARVGREMEFSDDQRWVTVRSWSTKASARSFGNVGVIGNTRFSTDESDGEGETRRRQALRPGAVQRRH